mmetsp:Transcript_28644/g.43285  ORF Transcript_28644/g.43285 Transcript_28644/m.43285 type:complete len:329 (+) Transcript_28644:70-1056(+)|eukprot:CAMPEP_0178922564 /NCGR_PEP_ID=MMETSP0786-20121207/16229_1 /TAXON_ID=186022 /ORGANISM="Thalassionema frauenfeldii, Strain CCMP 1798" /LENGTH=328 /DNA_ID=CAMNT_0020596953 /DNA_START=27 /DNA_END=1013 /DNA_ORIENTATION=-
MKYTIQHWLLAVTAIAASCIALAWASILETTYASTSRDLSIQEEKRTPKLGDGCYHVFLDVGANIGVHARFLMEPHKYPNLHEKTKQIFSTYFWTPAWDCRDICVFAFEPNPNHKKQHAEMTAAYNNVGIRYHHIAAGVGDLEGNTAFYHQGDESHNEWGFSSSNTAALLRGSDAIDVVQVPVIRLKTWLEDNIYERIIPQPYGKKMEGVSPKVVMKMDIEGSEYSVLPDLVMSGILCKTVNYIFGEFHQYGTEVKPNPDTGRGGLNVERVVGWDKYTLAMLDTMKSLRNDDCKLEAFDWHDDEAYFDDKTPLPGKVWWLPEESQNVQ